MPEADEWWGHCVGYPAAPTRPRSARYIRAHKIDTSLFAIGHTTSATVHDVRESLALRERVIDFAVDAQGLDAAELQAASAPPSPERR